MRTKGTTVEQPIRIIRTGDPVETKDHEGDMMPSMGYAEPERPYGGATTLAEVQAFLDVQETAEDVNELTSKFTCVIANIMDAEDLSPTEKASAVAAAAADFGAAAADPESIDTDDGEGGKSVGWFTRVKMALTGEKDWAKWNADHPTTGASSGGATHGAFHGALAHHTKRTGKAPSNGLKMLVDKLHAGSPQEKKAFVDYVTSGKGVEGKNLSDMVDKLKGMSDDEKKSFREFVTATAANDAKKEVALDNEQGAFASFKDHNGDWRFIATWSNNFFDRDGEVFPDSAHKEYEQYVDQTKDYPDLQLWHLGPASKSGKVDMIAYDDGMCLATGKWDEDKGDIAEAFSRAKDLGVSHGYTYSPFDVRNGAYLKYRTFEISPLPAQKAANIGTNFTSFAAKEEAPMLTAEKREWLVKTIGEDRASQIEENHRRMKKDLADKGISYKEFVEALAEGEASGATAPAAKAATEAAPAAAAAATAAAPTVITAPGGFTSSDGGDTWVKDKAAAPADPPTPATAAAPAVEAAKDVSFKEALVAAVKEATDPIMQTLNSHAELLTALKEGDDTKIANAWKAKNWGREVTSATETDTNLVDAEKAKTTLTAINGEGSADPAQPYVNDLMGILGLAKP